MDTNGLTHKFRGVEERDLEKIQEIYSKYHENDFRLLSNNSCVGRVIAVDKDDSIITYGSLHMLGEAIILQNMEKDVKTRLSVLGELLTQAIEVAKQGQLEQLHIFVKDPNFAALLIRHFNFKMIKDVPLVLNL